MIRGVVFDLDGVLADTEPVYQAMRTEYLSRFGVTLTPEQSRAFTGLRFLTGLEMLRAELPETVFRKIQEGFHPGEIDYAGYLRAAVPEVLDQLRLAGLKTAIASNSTPERIARFLETGHLQGRFDAVCSGADFGRGKPEPDVYLAACRQLGLPGAACAAVEDSDYGLLAARRAGCQVICLIDRRFGFHQTTADIWVQNLSEVPKAVCALDKMEGSHHYE